MKPVALPYPDTLNTLGDHIRMKRLDLGLRQKDFARQLGVDIMSVNYWENSRNQPSLRMIPRITDFLGYNPNLDAPAEETFGERIVRVRRSLGISQKRLAQQLGIDPATLAKWEHGRSTPTPENRELIEAFIVSAFEANSNERGLEEDA